MNAAGKPSIPFLTDTAWKETLAGAFKLFALFSAILLLSFLVLVDFSPAAQSINSSVSAPVQKFAAPKLTQKDAGPPAANPTGIKVTSPNAGDSLNVGSSKTIEWHYSGLSGTIKIFLYKGGVPTSGTPLSSMTLDNSGKGTFNWAINPNLIPGNYYTIVIESNNKPGVKGVTAPFSLVGPATSQEPASSPGK